MLLNIGAPDFFIKCSNPTTAAQVLQRVAAYCDALTLIKQFAPTPWLVDARTIVVWIHLLLPPLVSEFVSELAATDLRRMEISPPLHELARAYAGAFASGDIVQKGLVATEHANAGSVEWVSVEESVLRAHTAVLNFLRALARAEPVGPEHTVMLKSDWSIEVDGEPNDLGYRCKRALLVCGCLDLQSGFSTEAFSWLYSSKEPVEPAKEFDGPMRALRNALPHLDWTAEGSLRFVRGLDWHSERTEAEIRERLLMSRKAGGS